MAVLDAAAATEQCFYYDREYSDIVLRLDFVRRGGYSQAEVKQSVSTFVQATNKMTVSDPSRGGSSFL